MSEEEYAALSLAIVSDGFTITGTLVDGVDVAILIDLDGHTYAVCSMEQYQALADLLGKVEA